MDYAARRKEEIVEAMESCRAHDGEFNDPQFAELAAALKNDSELRLLFERVQQSDAAVAAAMADVPVPADLKAEVLHRLTDAASEQRADPVAPLSRIRSVVGVPPLGGMPAKAGTPATRFSRRRLIAGFAALTASAALLSALLWHFHGPSPMAPGQAIEDARIFFGHDNGPPGELLDRSPPPADYPISRDIASLRGIRWRRVKSFLGGEAVAYDLPLPGRKATLYVANRAVADLPSSPYGAQLTDTGGNTAGAWQADGRLYVLVVQGDSRTFDDCLVPRGPLT